MFLLRVNTYQEVEGQKQRKDNQSGKQRVLNISESRRSETNGYSSKSSAMVQCTSESRTTETPSLACDITRTVSIHIRILESRRAETFALRIDKATSSRCISESRRSEICWSFIFSSNKVQCISESKGSETFQLSYNQLTSNISE